MPELLYIGRHLLIAVLLILTGSGLPIPEEAIVVGAGVAAALHEINPIGGLLACVLGAMFGDLLAYGIGLKFGRKMLQKRGWFARLMHTEREKQIEVMISRHGLKVFFLARFLVGLRAPIYLTAGILKVPVRRFLMVDAISALVVISLFYGLAYKYGENVQNWIRRGEYAVTAAVVVGVLAVGIVFWVIRKRRQRAADRLEEVSSNSQMGPPEGSSETAASSGSGRSLP